MNTITKATIVNDGIVIEFGNSVICYFPASSLYNHLLDLKGQIFVTEDPSSQDGNAKTRETTDEEQTVNSLADSLLHQ